ncbi:RidA family protein [Pollutibacter soli]|uniref:RidA family protein n=1 Tax=Pollutibacter soli TaxID=3034157 RepID=UPI00301329C6
MKCIVFSLLICLSFFASAQNNQSVRFLNPLTIHKPNGYSHSAIIDLGNSKMVILSGQVALDKDGNLVGKADIAKQTEQVFANIKSSITEIGGNMNQLVKLNYFILHGQEIQPVREVRNKFINTSTPPASTLVKVSGLFRDDILIEIEATFIVPE